MCTRSHIWKWQSRYLNTLPNPYSDSLKLYDIVLSLRTSQGGQLKLPFSDWYWRLQISNQLEYRSLARYVTKKPWLFREAWNSTNPPFKTNLLYNFTHSSRICQCVGIIFRKIFLPFQIFEGIDEITPLSWWIFLNSFCNDRKKVSTLLDYSKQICGYVFYGTSGVSFPLYNPHLPIPFVLFLNTSFSSLSVNI